MIITETYGCDRHGEDAYQGCALCDLEALRSRLAEARCVCDEQATDAGLWFVAETAPEAYLQAALRRLHAAVEGTADSATVIVTNGEQSGGLINPSAVPDETGWVVEGAWSSPATPEYWVGSSAWSSDHMKALRFARREDAQQAADMMCAGLNVRICEHAWVSRSADSATHRETVNDG